MRITAPECALGGAAGSFLATASPESGSHTRKILRLARRLAREGRWSTLLAKTNDREAQAAEPLILRYRIVAARQLRDAEAAKRAAEIALSVPLAPLVRRVLVRELLFSRLASEAWALASADPAVLREPWVLRIAGRARYIASDESLRQAIDETLGALTKRSEIPPVRESAYAFPRPAAAPKGRGGFEIVAAPGVNGRHRDHLIRLERTFRDGLRDLVHPTIEEYTNVFVDRHGQIWTPGGGIIRSQGRPLSDSDMAAAPVIPEACIAMRGTTGFYHWIVDTLPNLMWLVGEHAPRVPILLSDRAPAFERDTLRLLGIPDAQVEAVGDVALCRRLLVPRVQCAGMPIWNSVAPLFERIAAEARRLSDAEGAGLPRAIYISRQDARRRPLDNESELEARLGERGIEAQVFSRMPLHRQIAMVSRAETIVGPHGAGLAHLAFADPAARVIESIPVADGDSRYGLRFNYARLSILRGLDYSAWIEEPPLVANSWSMNVDAFMGFLNRSAA